MTVVTIRAKAFSGEGVRSYKVRVDLSNLNGGVTVYDSVAGHYTTLHCLNAAAIKRAQDKAIRIAASAR